MTFCKTAPYRNSLTYLLTYDDDDDDRHNSENSVSRILKVNQKESDQRISKCMRVSTTKQAQSWAW